MSESPEVAKPSKNGKVALTQEIIDKCVDACSSGFTIEKCAGLIGVPIGTLKTWTHRNPSFARRLETARKNHEISLLKSIELAGEKSWQAKAWLAERIYNHAVPSSRLSVDTSVTHNAGQGFAQLLAGLASRRAEKKAQVIDAKEVKALPQPKSEYNSYCATDNLQPIVTTTSKNPGKPRPLRMRKRKPRQESLKKWPLHDTPLPTPPATDSTRNTPLNNCDTKQKEDHAQETSQGSAEGS